jgi:carbamoyl-phosphate synthase large subunit
LKEQIGFPLVIKPRIGRGARDTFMANNEKQMKLALAYVPDPIIQEYVGGYEFTSGIFFDRRSNVKGIITMQRELEFGTTYRAIVDSFPKVDEEMIRISEVLSQQGAIGPINVQSRYCSGKVYILEINPRFSGTSPIRAYFNFNEAEAAVKHFLLNEEIDELKPSTGVAMRYFEELYTTLEDVKQIKEGEEIENSKCIIPGVF